MTTVLRLRLSQWVLYYLQFLMRHHHDINLCSSDFCTIYISCLNKEPIVLRHIVRISLAGFNGPNLLINMEVIENWQWLLKEVSLKQNKDLQRFKSSPSHSWSILLKKQLAPSLVLRKYTVLVYLFYMGDFELTGIQWFPICILAAINEGFMLFQMCAVFSLMCAAQPTRKMMHILPSNVKFAV